jgi:regulator of RNase E activity RraB
MKAKLLFDLSDPDQKMEHLRCVKSTDMALALWQISVNAKKQCYRIAEGKEMQGESVDYINLVFEKIYEIMEEHSIDVDDLVI